MIQKTDEESNDTKNRLKFNGIGPWSVQISKCL